MNLKRSSAAIRRAAYYRRPQNRRIIVKFFNEIGRVASLERIRRWTVTSDPPLPFTIGRFGADRSGSKEVRFPRFERNPPIECEAGYSLSSAVLTSKTRVPQFRRPSTVCLESGGIYSVASQMLSPLGSTTAKE